MLASPHVSVVLEFDNVRFKHDQSKQNIIILPSVRIESAKLIARDSELPTAPVKQ